MTVPEFVARIQRKRSRESAARVLYDAGWKTHEIAYALRWKIGHAERLLVRREYISETPLTDAMGMEVSLRAAKAIERLGVKTVAAVRANFHRLRGMRGVGAKTISEIQTELNTPDKET